MLEMLNARTSNNSDYIENDKFDEAFGIENNEKLPSRNSEDPQSCPRGSCLLDMCKSMDYLILNGRKTGDIFGKFTSFQWNGNSVVDYVITQASFFDNISTLQVGQFIPWLSDHCNLTYKLSFKHDMNRKQNDPTVKLSDLPTRYIWNSLSKERFDAHLQTDTFKNIFENIVTFEGEKNSEKIVKTLTESILRCAESSGIPTQKKDEKEVTKPPLV